MKRNLFDELKEYFSALQDAREEKITLRTHAIEKKAAPSINPEELLSIRQSLHLSRSVFARYLRTNLRALENLKQGRAKPNAQAAVLIRMAARYPDTVERLSAI